MSKNAYVNEDGTLVIDLTEADRLWNSMSMEQQYEAMCLMFDPLLNRATEMHKALEQISQSTTDKVTAKIASDAVRTTGT